FHSGDAPEPVYSDTLELDLGQVEPSIAGPGRPQDRVPLARAREAFAEALPGLLPPEATARSRKQGADGDIGVWGEGEYRAPQVDCALEGEVHRLTHGSVV